jgi:WD40 repeat protein/energy-coupling factor transporter ATP-binding protein EcfA2
LYDVFLSYNSKNREEAQAIVHALEDRLLGVFWDRGALRAGRRWLRELEESLTSCRAIVILVGPDGLGAWQTFEVEAAINLQVSEGSVLVIPVLLPGAQALSLFLKSYTWIDLQSGITDVAALNSLVASVNGVYSKSDLVTQASVVWEIACPYRGLLSFREDDAEYFFGRQKVVEELEKALDKGSFVALVGSSGSGKSSVVQAGLIHHLRRASDDRLWDFALMKPTDKPIRSLAAALFPLLEPGKSGIERARGIKDLSRDLLTGKLDLSDLIGDREKRPGVERFLLVVDQWEELYTLRRGERAHSRFISQLDDALREGVLSVVCTLRRDFIPRALDEPGLGDRFEDSMVYLRTMHRDELRSAIEEPAKRVGLSFQDGLIERLLDDLGDEPGQLPLLEFVLRELWKRRQDKVLRHVDYERLGGGRKAIASRAEEIFSNLAGEKQEVAHRLFLRLVRPGEGTEDTRRRANLSEIGEAEKSVVQSMVDARLLTTSLEFEEVDEIESAEDLERSEGTVEITHEALISHWDRLRKWLNDDRDFLLWRERLRLSRSTWEHEGHEEGFLLTRAPLAEAEEWIDTRRRDLTEAEEDFIAHSLKRHYGELQKEAERQKAEQEEKAAIERHELEREAARQKAERDRKERFRKRLTLSLAVLALIFLSLALFGFWRWRISLSHALAAEAVALHEGPLDLALLLSLQAEKTADTVEAKDSLLTLLEESPSLKAFLPGHRGRVSRAVFSPDGRTIASGGAGDIFLWDGETGNRLEPPLRGHQGDVIGLAFSPDGTVLASSGADQTIRLWRVADHLPLRPPLVMPLAVRNFVISPDGRLAAAIRGTTIYLWDFPSLQSRGEIPQAGAAFISDLAFDRNGRLAAARADGTIVLWDIAQRSKIRTFKANDQQVLSLAFLSSKDILASAGADQKVRLWNVANGEELGTPPDGHRGTVLSVAFSRDGQTLASAGRDKTILLWNVASGQWDLTNSRPSATLVGHGKTIWTLAFGERGHLVSGGDDDAAILWHLQAAPRFANPVTGFAGEADSVAFNGGGDLLAVGGKDGAIRLWDTVARQPRGPALLAHQGAINGLAFRDGTLLSGGADGRILIWDLDHPGTRPRELASPDGTQVWSLALSPDRRTVAAGDDLGRVRLWSLAPERFLGETGKRHEGFVYGLAFSPDGGFLASGAQDSLIRLWDVRQRKLLKELKGHEEPVSGLAFSPDGQIMASSSMDRTVRLWSPKTGRQLIGSPLSGLDASLTGVAFDADGKTLGASSLNGRVYLWDVESRNPIGIGLRGAGEAFNLAFHPDGRHLASGNDRSVLLFDLRVEAWRSEACRTVGRNLSKAEWRKYMRREPYRQTCPENTGLESLANRLDGALRTKK